MRLFLNTSLLSGLNKNKLIRLIESYEILSVPLDTVTDASVKDWIMVKGCYWYEVAGYSIDSLVRDCDLVLELTDSFDQNKLKDILEIIRDKNRDFQDFLESSLKIDITTTPRNVDESILNVSVRVGNTSLGRVIKRLVNDRVHKIPIIK